MLAPGNWAAKLPNDANPKSTRGHEVKVTIDVDRCTGHQMCAIAAPKVFGSDDYGNAIVLAEGDIPAELQAATRIAHANCPERAIILEEV